MEEMETIVNEEDLDSLKTPKNCVADISKFIEI